MVGLAWLREAARWLKPRADQVRSALRPTFSDVAASPMLPLTAGAIAIGIFLVDTITSLEIAIAVVYVVVVLIAAVFLRRRGVLLVSWACLALTV